MPLTFLCCGRENPIQLKSPPTLLHLLLGSYTAAWFHHRHPWFIINTAATITLAIAANFMWGVWCLCACCLLGCFLPYVAHPIITLGHRPQCATFTSHHHDSRLDFLHKNWVCIPNKKIHSKNLKREIVFVVIGFFFPHAYTSCLLVFFLPPSISLVICRYIS